MVFRILPFRAFCSIIIVLFVVSKPENHAAAWINKLHSCRSSSPFQLKASATPESAAKEANRLKQQAKKLREEIASFQKEKDSLEENERQQVQAELEKKQAWIDRYSATVPILKPDGSTVIEKVQFPPILKDVGESNIIVFEAKLPLGIILGEHESIDGMTVVDEIIADGNGQAAGIQVGDIIRGCTSCQVQMDQPMWQLMAGGIGRPKTFRFVRFLS